MDRRTRWRAAIVSMIAVCLAVLLMYRAPDTTVHSRSASSSPPQTASPSNTPNPTVSNTTRFDVPEPPVIEEPHTEEQHTEEQYLVRCRIRWPEGAEVGYTSGVVNGWEYRVDDDGLTLFEAPRIGRASVPVPGWDPLTARWSMSEDDPSPRCLPIRVKGNVEITGYVEHATSHEVSVQGCGGTSRVQPDGHFTMSGSPGRCALFASRRDGMLTVRSEPKVLDLSPGIPMSVELSLPAEPQGGMGITLQEVEGGIMVMNVHADTPAERLGLQAGDVVVEIDGVAAHRLSAWDFVDLGVGPVGSTVRLLVDQNGELTEVSIRRERIIH